MHLLYNVREKNVIRHFNIQICFSMTMEILLIGSIYETLLDFALILVVSLVHVLWEKDFLSWMKISNGMYMYMTDYMYVLVYSS